MKNFFCVCHSNDDETNVLCRVMNRTWNSVPSSISVSREKAVQREQRNLSCRATENVISLIARWMVMREKGNDWRNFFSSDVSPLFSIFWASSSGIGDRIFPYLERRRLKISIIGEQKREYMSDFSTDKKID